MSSYPIRNVGIKGQQKETNVRQKIQINEFECHRYMRQQRKEKGTHIHKVNHLCILMALFMYKIRI